MFTYETRIRISLPILTQVVSDLRASYEAIGSRDSHEGRCAFSRWNNASKFLERLLSGEIPSEPINDTRIFTATAEAKGGSTRIYFKPSFTSLDKSIRKAILPLNPSNVFVYFDLKAAEFALNCYYAQEYDALKAYHQGFDIYLHFANLFPEGTPRSVIKTILIANLYGATAYSTAQRLGVSEEEAEELLKTIARKTPRLSDLKRSIVCLDSQHHGYCAPNGFSTASIKKVSDISGMFNNNLAYSTFTQSGLGFIMQELTSTLLTIQRNVDCTLVSVFDSVLLEINPESADRYESFITRHLYPLLPDGFRYGSTFAEAQGL